MSELSLHKRMYLELFHAITCAVSMLDTARNNLRGTTGAQKEQALEENIELAIIDLRKAQLKTEQIYMED